MCTNNTCNPEVDCPNEDESTSGSNCTSGSGSNCTSGAGSNCSSGSSCNGSCDGSCNGSCGDCCDGTCNSTVPVQSVTVSPSAVTVKIGRWCHDLSAEVTPAEANQHVCWSSSDPYVASVNPETGYVYGMREGTAVITATSCEDSSISDSCSVTVVPVLVESITLCKTVLEIDKGTTYNMCATVCPEDADNKSLYWSSSDPNVATVSQTGVITGNSSGRTTIRVTATDGSGVFVECAVKVMVPVTSVVIGRPNFTAGIGRELALVATVLPADANNLRWHSNNPSVATVRASADPRIGLVTTKAAGTATIYVTSNDDTSITDSCVITVEPVTEATETRFMEVGESLGLKNVLLPSSMLNEPVVWISSNETVAAVDEDGDVSAQKAGTAVIYANTELGECVAACNICVSLPDLFTHFVEDGTIKAADIKFTNDDFFIMTASLGDILSRHGFTALEYVNNNNVVQHVSVSNYNKWYIFAYKVYADAQYGLYKMCAEDNDTGVTISFVALDQALLLACLVAPSADNVAVLGNHLFAVTEKKVMPYDESIVSYFSDAVKDGSYLIADVYTHFVAQNCEDGILPVPSNFKKLLQYNADNPDDAEDRLPQWLAKVNEDAGTEVYCDDGEEPVIRINDPNALTLYEQYAILATYTADQNFYMFAAEVEIHAKWTGWDLDNLIPVWVVGEMAEKVYASALRADMAIYDAPETDMLRAWFDSLYYDISAQAVTNQMLLHFISIEG